MAQNADLDKFINDLAFDVESAIQDYVGIVLANSVWPDGFPVAIEHHFDLANRELTLTATVPPPGEVPAVKEYKYVRARDEVASTTLPVKEQKERYAAAVWQVALRVLHEVFEADRAAEIHSISLTVGASHIAPHTGLPEFVPFAIVAADRATFALFRPGQCCPARHPGPPGCCPVQVAVRHDACRRIEGRARSGSGVRFNPPPGWPQPPAGWTPPPGWQPDPSWPASPPGWQLWLSDDPSPPPTSSPDSLPPTADPIAITETVAVPEPPPAAPAAPAAAEPEPAQPPSPNVTATAATSVSGPLRSHPGVGTRPRSGTGYERRGH